MNFMPHFHLCLSCSIESLNYDLDHLKTRCDNEASQVNTIQKNHQSFGFVGGGPTSVDTVRGCFRHWKHTARLRQDREWVQDCTSECLVHVKGEWVYWLWHPVSSCRSTMGISPTMCGVTWSSWELMSAVGQCSLIRTEIRDCRRECYVSFILCCTHVLSYFQSSVLSSVPLVFCLMTVHVLHDSRIPKSFGRVFISWYIDRCLCTDTEQYTDTRTNTYAAQPHEHQRVLGWGFFYSQKNKMKRNASKKKCKIKWKETQASVTSVTVGRDSCTFLVLSRLECRLWCWYNVFSVQCLLCRNWHNVISTQCFSSTKLTQCEFCPVLVLFFDCVDWIHVWWHLMSNSVRLFKPSPRFKK